MIVERAEINQMRTESENKTLYKFKCNIHVLNKGFYKTVMNLNDRIYVNLRDNVIDKL